jgi:DNA-binding CsgD family transcriptional regulator
VICYDGGVDQVELEGMPESAVLRVLVSDGQTLVTFGRMLLYCYDSDDLGMRNLAIVALTDAKQPIKDVAAAFAMTATYVSMLRTRARALGSAGLVRRLGRPPKLSARQVTQAREWASQGRTQQAIADQLGVARSVISELLAKLGPAPVQQHLPAVTEPTEEPTGQAMGEPVVAEPVPAEPAAAAGEIPAFTGSSRIGSGQLVCRYAGAMLLHPFLHRVGAEAIFASLTGGPARRYDDLAVLSSATLGFALGIDTVEGAKHLRRADAGAAVGLAMVPELKTFRTRLGALADGADPLGLQRAFAAGMLSADPAADPVYFVDDHFVPYSGAQPVAKGWNTKRRHAQPGQDDTMLVDARGRAVVFASGEPSGLVTTLPGVLTQLRQVLGPDAKILLGFDRGGAFASAFGACRDAGADWVTYRRAPLVEATVAPRRSWTVRDGTRITVMLADEIVELKDYGSARQLTLFEDGTAILQVLTSDLTATGASLLCWLRARWRIENMFKYAVEHNGIDRLADYCMELGPDTRKVTNPARVAARETVKAAQAALIAAERAVPQMLAGPGSPKQMNTALPQLHRKIEIATRALEQAKTDLRPNPAKVLATDLDPDAQRARPRLERRGLQMVLRLLAFNAEAWLAEHFNTYLTDPNEYRATLRHLLRLGGQIDYTKTQIVVTLDRPDSPRVARALTLLTEELNAQPANLPGDRRPLTYLIAAASITTVSPALLPEV